MKGSEQKLIRFMEGSSKRFIIPVYQRNYDWKIEQCKQLYNDLFNTIKYKRKSHFFGSIVSVQNELGTQDEYLIIDGQQRITTVSLIFLAIYNLINNNIINPKIKNIKIRVYEDYLVDKYEIEETKLKLKHIKNDEETFKLLFGKEDYYIENSNLTINYRYFYDCIKKDVEANKYIIEDLFDAISKLQIINISLNSEDNPQLIFESLNSTGLDLTEGDRIRNYVLMNLSIKKQELFYEKYWNRIEKNTLYDVTFFIRDYLSIKVSKTPPIKKVYVYFKEFVEDNDFNDIEELLIDLLQYSRRYEVLIKANTKNLELNSCIKRMNLLETTITRPFLLEVINLYEKNIISLDEEVEIFKIVESYIFRRIICQYPSNVLNKIFIMLHKEIFKYDGTLNDYFEKFKYALKNKTKKAAFPCDNEFIEAFSNYDIYKMHSKNKKYIFERFENIDTLEQKNIWELIDRGIYTIEHIMPQKLSYEWIKSLGENSDIIHSRWLHKIANLTLTAYNSKYSNKSFDFKRDSENGFKNSGIRMNQKIAQCLEWTEQEIEDRNNELMFKALKIWKNCYTNYVPIKKEFDIYILDDSEDFTNKIIKKFSLFSIEYDVISWIDMYIKVLKILHKRDNSILANIANGYYDFSNLDSQVLNNIEEFNPMRNNYEKIDEKIYVNKNTSTLYKISLLIKFFKLYKIENSELIFYIKNNM